MGSRFATRWLEAGFDLVGFDSDAEAVARVVNAGARQAGSVAEVADRAETVFVSLPTPESVYDVACGGADCLATGSAIRTYVDLSTTGPSIASEVASALSARSIQCLDAPVSGGPAGAEAGSLTIMASGSNEAMMRVRPLLEAIGSRVFIAGDAPGQAQLVKLINNLLSATAIAITGEALVLGAKAGLDPRVVLDVVNVSSGANNAAADKFPRQVLTRAFNHGFRLDLMTKDVRLCLTEAHDRGVPMVVGQAVEGLWKLATEQLEPGADCTAIVRMLEEWAGATVTTPGQL
jgi:3-hydroxyisobutyrate dehydrogenase-like beta-hydroxyacid dehydrogenase